MTQDAMEALDGEDDEQARLGVAMCAFPPQQSARPMRIGRVHKYRLPHLTQAADEAVDKVLHELAADAMGGAASAGTRQLQAEAAAGEEEEENMETLRARLEQIKQ